MLQIFAANWAEKGIGRDRSLIGTLKTGDCLHKIRQNSVQQLVTCCQLPRIIAFNKVNKLMRCTLCGPTAQAGFSPAKLLYE
jgi:hypothetical protein